MALNYLDRRTLSGGIVNLTVGHSETPFDVHIELLCDRSPYFDKLLENRYTESPNGELVFSNDDPDVFADFVSWVYCGNISTGLKSSRRLHFFQLWTLAERFQVAELQELALVRIKEILAAHPELLISRTQIEHAYGQSRPGSALRLLAVDTWAARASKSDVQIGLKRHFLSSARFFEDLMVARPDIRDLSASEFGESKSPQMLEFQQRPPSTAQFFSSLPDAPLPGQKPQLASASQRAARKFKTPHARLCPDSSQDKFSMGSVSREIVAVEDEDDEL
ncbi:uncharacterized protein DSM5745_04598 [Aspergillus mulundensis]|uniref:BTB domain-containing protein n=1 Tax=Aspergillus mulundensis TaxID=1810919 RepID=A0A3D8S4K6_9EURO|nr:hypothetical protein DSM5745_04598 [Aspergillus mulundensis]RDW81041.1 hypothetical protein DSM5745_04598 [Aspergillus mulundensis]